jgi:hypothetical protein
MMIARTEKSTSQIIYQMTTGHALIGSHLKRIQKIESDVYWWCQCGATQTREHLFKYCRRWKGQHKVLWKSVREASGRLMTSTSIKDLLWDRRCSAAVIEFFRSTEIGRRYRERGQEEDDPGGELNTQLRSVDEEC